MKKIWTSEKILDIHARLVGCMSRIDMAYRLPYLSSEDMMILSDMRRQCDSLKMICAEKIISSNSLDDQSFATMFSSVPSFLALIETSLVSVFSREVV